MPVTSPQGTLDFKKVDKITFVGASSNTVIDTTTGSVGIGVVGDALSSNLHVVGDTRMEGNINMLHTSNTASIKLNSNVVTEFPRSKKLMKFPRVAMTQNDESATSGYVTNASSWENQANNETYGPWNNFNGLLNDSAWQSYPRRFSQTTGDWDGTTTAPYAISLVGGSTIYGEWVELKIPNKIQLHTCRISPLTSTTYPNLGKHRSPRSGYILGRVGATGNWTVLKSWSDIIHGWEDLVLRDFDIENPSEYYDYFRVVWTAINGNNNYSTSAGAGYASSGEIEFLGLPEYDPEAHGTDVVVKSEANVPNTDWLEVYYDAKNYTNGVVQDETVNNRDGTLYGDTSLSSADGIHKFDFDGNGDYIKTTLTGFTGTTVTFSAWVFMDSIDTSRPNTIMGLGNWGSTGSAAWIAVGSGGNLETGNNGIASCGGSVQATTLTKRWLHITGIVSSGDFRFYQDGQLIKSLTTTGTINYGTNPVLYIATRADSSGNPEATRYFDCKIANARLFNRALTTDEIYQLYAYQKEYFGHSTNSMTLKAGRLGIGTSEPKAALDVRGDISYDGVIKNKNPIAFAVYRDYINSSNSRDHSYTGNPMFNTVHYNYGGHFDISDSKFIVPVNGLYHFGFSAYTNQSAGTQSRLMIKVDPVDGGSTTYLEQKGFTIEVHGNGINTNVYCNAGDKIWLSGNGSTQRVYMYTAQGHNRFYGYLIYAL